MAAMTSVLPGEPLEDAPTSQDDDRTVEVMAMSNSSQEITGQVLSKRSFKKKESVARVFGFADPDMIKERIRETLSAATKQEYDVSMYYKEEGWAQHIARHAVFEQATLAVIVLNALYIWIDTDFNKKNPMTPTETYDLQDAGAFFVFMENFFCVYFTFEWVVRFLAFENKLNCLRDGWFKFDSVLVLFMVLETWVLLLVIAISGSDGENPVGGAGMLRLLRLLRLSRLVRMLRSNPELMILIKGMIAAMRSVIYVMCLLVIITYVFAIAFTQMSVIPEEDRQKPLECLPEANFTNSTCIGDVYFSNVALSMYSLFIYATFLDDVSVFMDEIRDPEFGGNYYLFWMVLIFECLAALTVMNMLIGVLCEMVSATAETEKEQILQDQVSGTLLEVARGLDINTDNMVSYEEFLSIIEKPKALQALQDVDVDPIAVIEFSEYFFFEEGEAVDLTFESFMDEVLALKRSNTATFKDVSQLWMQMKTNVNKEITQLQAKIEVLHEKFDRKMERIEAMLATIISEVQSLTGRVC